MILNDLTEILKVAGIQEPYHILESSFKPMGIEGQLRLVIDKPDGVTIQDLAMLTRKLSNNQDLTSELGLENLRVDISSPGATADLTQKWQYGRHKGRKLKVTLKSGEPDELKYIEGVLEGADDSGLSVISDSTTQNIPWDAIQKSNVQLDW
jgi:ribosome maturation factor RimP